MKSKFDKCVDYFNYIFFSIVVVACIVIGILQKISVLTIVACVFGIIYVVFLSDRNIWSFLIGLVANTTYIFVAFSAKLYGEVLFYLVIDLPMIFISYFMWKKHMEDTIHVEVKKLSLKNMSIITIGSCAFVAIYAYVLHLIGGVNVIVDAISTVVSFIATLLMAYRYREQWIMWIVVYAVSIVMWAITFDLLMLLMSVSCFVSCVIGYITWTRNVKLINQNENFKEKEK